MMDGPARWQELDSLLDRVLDGIYDDEDLRRLNEMLRVDVEACRRYVLYVELHGRLAWGDALSLESARAMGVCTPMEVAGSIDSDGAAAHQSSLQEDRDNPPASIPFAPIMVPTSPDLPSSFSPFGSFLFSYAVAVVTVGIGLLVGWACQVSISPSRVAHENVASSRPTAIAHMPEIVFVGQITGTFDCQSADLPTAVTDHAYVSLGRRFALASGLMEISYDAGAKVILQGPCIYDVTSRTGGYLALGRLTANVGKRGEGRGEREKDAANHRSINDTRKYPSSFSPLRPPLFTVRTPTAIVTDLGTEFGVEVDKSGTSQAHVFRGKVEIRAAAGGNAKAVLLRDNESGRIDLGNDRVAGVVRESPRKNTFVREMPRAVPIRLFNTGVGLKTGDPDPHWQVVARSDDPKFKPQSAVVVSAGTPEDLQNDPARSQWLSLVGDALLPEDVVYVFQTTFDLTGMSLSKAMLQGKFIADDRVVAIRLNGRRLSVPLQHDGEPFSEWTAFRAATGFVKGTNVLEIDVLNANPCTPPSKRRTAMSRACCRVEMEGVVSRDPGLAGDGVSAETSRTLARGVNTAMASKERSEQDGTDRGAKEMPSAGAR